MAAAVTAVPVAIALGSNLGDRRAHLEFGIARLSELLVSPRVSTIRETDFVGAGRQPAYLNAALVGDTTLPPDLLLDELLRIERTRGRERPWPAAPRTLDLDLILYGKSVLRTERLEVPHPRFRERGFVLEPLAEISPALADPVTNVTIAELWAALRLRSP